MTELYCPLCTNILIGKRGSGEDFYESGSSIEEALDSASSYFYRALP